MLTSANINHYGYSDFGHAFSTFHQRYAPEMTHRTTIIIIGDARNNRKVARDDLLKSWKHKVNKIIWINPETRHKWNTGDSIINIYAKQCDKVVECSNIEQLANIIDDFVL